MTKGPEATLEHKAIKFAEAHGWYQIKIMQASERGFPDRFFARGGRVILIEFKRLGETPSAQQALRHKELNAAGVEVYWIDNMEDFRVLFA